MGEDTALPTVTALSAEPIPAGVLGSALTQAERAEEESRTGDQWGVENTGTELALREKSRLVISHTHPMFHWGFRRAVPVLCSGWFTTLLRYAHHFGLASPHSCSSLSSLRVKLLSRTFLGFASLALKGASTAASSLLAPLYLLHMTARLGLGSTDCFVMAAGFNLLCTRIELASLSLDLSHGFMIFLVMSSWTKQ